MSPLNCQGSSCVEQGLVLRKCVHDPPEARAAQSPLPATAGRGFYESDCQGQFSSLLIAFRSCPLQSAPTDRNAGIVRTRGWAEQSYAADSSSVSPLILSETISSAPSITWQRCRSWFYLRLTLRMDVRGLSLLLVIRGGLWLGK